MGNPQGVGHKNVFDLTSLADVEMKPVSFEDQKFERVDLPAVVKTPRSPAMPLTTFNKSEVGITSSNTWPTLPFQHIHKLWMSFPERHSEPLGCEAFEMPFYEVFDDSSEPLDAFLPSENECSFVEPQSFMGEISRQAFLAQLRSGDYGPKLVDAISTAVTSYVALSQAQTVSAFLATLDLTLKSAFGISTATIVYKQMVEFLDLQQTVEQQSDSQQDSQRPQWLKALQLAGDNWQLAVSNPAFTRISKLLTMAVTVGVLGPASINLGKMKLFSLEAQKEQVSATNLTDAIFKTALFLCESGYAAWQTSSVMPFLFSKSNAVRLDAEYLELSDLYEYAIPGNLSAKDITPNEFDKRFSDCISETQSMHDSMPSCPEKKFIYSRLIALTAKYTKYRQTRVTGNMRPSPYTFFITGGSSLGKTDIATILTDTCGIFNDIDVSPNMCYTFNDADAYMSNYKSYMTVLRFDDVVNTNSNYVGGVSPLNNIIKVCNNVKEVAVMPDLESKGVVFLEPKFVTITSNVRDINSSTFSNCPASILRRGNIHIFVRVKEQFQKDNSPALDPRKVNAFYTDEDGVVRQPDIPDLWDLDCHNACVVPVDNNLTGTGQYVHKKEQCIFVPIITPCGKSLINVSIMDVIEHCMTDSKEHFQHQDALVERSENSEIKFCELCRKPLALCAGCSVPEEEGIVEEQSDDNLCDDWFLMTPFLKKRFYKYRHSLRLMNTMSLSQWQKRQTNDNIKASWPQLLNLTSSWMGFYLSHLMTWWSTGTLNYLAHMEYVLEHVAPPALLEMFMEYQDCPLLQWTSWIPEQWLNNPHVLKILVASKVVTLRGNVYDTWKTRWSSWTLWFPTAFAFCLGYFLQIPYVSHALYVPFLYTLQKCVMNTAVTILQMCNMKKMAEERLRNDHTNSPALFKSIRDNNGKYLVGGVCAVATLYAMYKVWKEISFTVEQGNLAPSSPEEILVRDKEVNMWKAPERETVLPDKIVASMPQMETIISKNLCYLEVCGIRCDALIVRSNMVAVPMHVVSRAFEKAETPMYEFTRRSIDKVNAKFKCLVSKGDPVRIGDADLALIHVPTTGDVKNIIPLFPTDLPTLPVPTEMYFREKDGSLSKDHTIVTFGKVDNGVRDDGIFGKNLRKFPGCSYNLEQTVTRPGLCMGTHVANTKQPYIAGLHLGGITGTKYGVAACLTNTQLTKACAELNKDLVVFQAAASSSNMDYYHKPMVTKPSIHYKCPSNFLEEGNFRVFGACDGRKTFKSRVEPSVLTDIVEEVCGVPNIWGPPKGNGPNGDEPWYPWRESLKYSANPSAGIPPHLLRKGMVDYMEPLKEKLNNDREFFSTEIRKLTDVETVSGIDGKRFIDSMNMSTSMGYGITGTKADHVIKLEPTKEHNDPKTFKEEHWESYRAFEERAKRGERSNLPFDTCIKDEPTPVNKDKVRLFQGASVTLQLGLRKYFLPVARFLSTHPLLSECAVGINAHGPEMDQLFKFIMKEPKRGYAGDYSKYDLRMPAQMVYASFQVLIEFAKEFPENYSAEDIQVMETLATEVACAYSNFNGTLVEFLGSNPSGQSLTAYINSICNSLLHRASYFAKCGMQSPPFRESVNIATYGDDYDGSINKGVDYNNIDFVTWCAKYDMVVTAPDKDSDILPYWDCTKIDFLKRRPRYDERLKHTMGVLDENSIWKSLHSNVRSRTETKEQVAASCMGSALAEWFLHGEEVYNHRVEQMREVATRSHISHMVVGLGMTYVEREEAWLEKYFG